MRYRLLLEVIEPADSLIDAIIAMAARWPGSDGHIVRVETYPDRHERADDDDAFDESLADA